MKRKKRMMYIICIVLVFCFSHSAFAEEKAVSRSDVQEVIEKFYNLSYESIIEMDMKDMSSVLNEDSLFGRNYSIYLKEIIAQNKYSFEAGYTDFKPAKMPFTVSIEKVEFEDSKAQVTVNVTGVDNEGYPLFICQGKNIFVLNYENRQYLIESLQADDVFIKMLNEKQFKEVDAQSIYKRVDQEYSFPGKTSARENDLKAYPYQDHSYSSSRAVKYANQFVSTGNSYFYTAGADCTNFVSQCIAYGFGSGNSYSSANSYRMVSGIWSAGSGGGYPAWESVGTHWNYMFQSKTNQDGPRVSSRSWSTLSNGGIMQIDFDSDGTYDHSVICVSKSLGKFAQHTVNHYNYYQNYTGNKRFYQPLYFREY